ncbi:MAG: flagellar biosynthetic protein FliO [Deferribacteres bacterium]|nr:flagellar biosynthetic protein FliO [candidate division KSB1 bacterium]MCB9501937.1 flagellar biosynthetic protein FliO [Deferribacteres bacterium]
MMKPEYKNQLKKFLPLALITLLFGLAFIQIIPGNGSQAEETSPVMGDFATVKTIAVLAFVFFLLAVFAWVAKKYIAPMGGLRRAGSEMQVIENLPLSPKSRIVLVKIADEKLVLGVTEQSITVLTELETSENETEPKAVPPHHRFLRHLQSSK